METILRRPARPSFVLPPPSWRAPRLLLPLLAALLPAAPPLPLAGQGAWDLDPEETPPPAREKHTLTQSGSKIYLFGGLATMALDDLWQYDPATGAWTQVAPSGTPPPARHAGVAGQFLDSIFHYSDLTASGSLSSVMLSYGPSANLWSTVVQNGTTPGGRRDATLAEHTTGLFLFGGYSNAAGTTLADAFLYRFTAVSAVQGTWTKLAYCPAGPLAETAVAALPDPATGQTHLYYFGGVTGAGALSGKLMDYNVATGAWTEIAPASGVTPPVPRRGHSLAGRDILDPALAAARAQLLVLGGVDGAGGDVLAATELVVDRAAGTYTVKDLGSLPASLAGAAHVKLGTGPGSDGSGATEFLVFGGRVGGFVSAQQARLKVGAVYFPPALEDRAGGQLRVSWPDSILGGVVLQESASLAPGSPWADVAAAPTHENGRYHLDVDPSTAPGGRRFYRLRSP